MARSGKRKAKFKQGGSMARGGEVKIAKKFVTLNNKTTNEKQFNRKVELNKELNDFKSKNNIEYSSTDGKILVDGKEIGFIDFIDKKTGQRKKNGSFVEFEKGGSTYDEGGEIEGYTGGYDVTVFYKDGSQAVIEGGLPYPEALKVAKKQKIENDVEDVAVIVTDQSSMPNGEQTIRWVSGSTYAEGGEIKSGDFVKKKGSNLELKVVEVGNDSRSGKDFIKIYNDVTDNTITLVDWSDYELVSTYAKGGSVKKKGYFTGALSFLNW